MSDPTPVMAGREMLIVGDPLSCALCGRDRKGHGRTYGMGHLGDKRKTFVEPSEALIATRNATRIEPTTGLPYGGFRPDGSRLTNLVQAVCRCGGVVMATPEQAPTARCTTCLFADISEKGTSRA